MMRVGVLGTGRMGAFRARALAAHPDVEQVFVGSHHGERARELAEAIGGRGGTIDEVLGAELDALVISTATGQHPEHVAAGAQRGLPMLCEKPISIDVADTEATIDLVRKAGVDLQIAFMRRFDAGFRRARELVSTGTLGTVYSVRMCAHDHEPAEERYIATSGGIFVDLHVHDFDMARWLTGREVTEVFATGTVRAWEAYGRQDDVDTSAMVLTMDDGLPVVVTGARHDPIGYDFRAEILGSRDSIVVGVDGRTPVHSVQPDASPAPVDPYQGFLDRFRQAFTDETAAFVDLVLGRGPNHCPPGEALSALRVAGACETSWRERRVVELAEAADFA
jgi:myo-inositol 2-dehydrogenase / D-chiro-inositol 1-dehydrogenase